MTQGSILAVGALLFFGLTSYLTRLAHKGGGMDAGVPAAFCAIISAALFIAAAAATNG